MAEIDAGGMDRVRNAIGAILDRYAVGDLNRGAAIEELEKLISTAEPAEDPGRKRRTSGKPEAPARS